MARTFEPWFVVVVGARKNQKVTALPSDSARYGWFLGVLAEAKLQRPGGRFTSRDQLLEAIGRFGEYVDDYLRVGLLEQAPRLCPTCRKVHGSVPAGVLVVHDWRRHQRDPGAAERAAGWRAEHAGERDGYDGETPDERPTNDEQTQDEREPYAERTVSDTADSRARAMTPDSDSDSDNEDTGERHTPQPPASGGRPSRADGTSPRQAAAAKAEQAAHLAEAKRWRTQQRQLAYFRGAMTEAQWRDMDAADTPLEEIPGWAEYQASKAEVPWIAPSSERVAS